MHRSDTLEADKPEKVLIREILSTCSMCVIIMGSGYHRVLAIFSFQFNFK